MRLVTLGWTAFLPPLIAYCWAYYKTDWLVQQSWWRSGRFDAVYEPRFIHRPIEICTILLCSHSLIVATLALARKWKPIWLLWLPVTLMVWMSFEWMMLRLDDNVFP
jgi:hypothetical protein